VASFDMVSVFECFFFCGIRLTYRVEIPGHINNLYNTTFWALVQQGGLSAKEAEKELMV